MSHTCRYVLTPNTEGQAAMYCDNPVKYRMVEDDDGYRVRKYDAFCPEHQALVDAEEDEE